MKIGIIGTGHIGKALASKLVKAGYPVILSNSRGVQSLQPLVVELGSLATAGTNEEASSAEVVILAVRWEQIPGVVSQLQGQLAGKIVIDASNQPTTGSGNTGHKKPSSAIVAALIPEAKIVKAFNTLYAKWIEADPAEGNGKRVTFISGDHPQAKQTVAGIITQIGFAVVDLGTLEQAGPVTDLKTPLSGLNLVSYPI